MNKLCKNCNWYKSNDYYYTGTGIHAECLCPEIEKPENPVTGEPIMKFCLFERLDSGQCGPGAKYWEPKKPKETKEQFWNRLFNFGLR